MVNGQSSGCPQFDECDLPNTFHYFAFSADGEFTGPCPVGDTITDSAVDEPAEFPGIKLPGRTLFPFFIRAFFDLPTFAEIFSATCSSGKKEKKLPLNMTRNRAPTLLIAAYRLERDSQKTGSFLLCFVKFFPDVSEFFAVHVTLSSTALRWC